MIHRHYLVVGAGAAGEAACEGIRQYDQKGQILLVGAEPHLPYNRSLLSKSYLSGSTPKVEGLYLRPEGYYADEKIDFRSSTAVKQINMERHQAVLSTGQAVQFEKACLAMGSRARKPMVAGTNLGNIFFMRTLNEASGLHEIAQTQKEPVVIGGGLLGAEVAASLVALKCNVTLLDRNEFLWQDRVDNETAQWLTAVFQEHGIKMMMREGLNGFEGKTVLRNIQTKSGVRLTATAAFVALGADPMLDLVANTPLSTPLGTPVNELLETEEKGIYAAGDIALYPDKVFGGVRRTQHWEHARQQGLIAGANMTGKKRQKFTLIPRYSTKVFDLEFTFLGDLTRPPGRTVMEGDHAKKSFVAKYYVGERLKGAAICNKQDVDAICETIEAEIRETHAP